MSIAGRFWRKFSKSLRSGENFSDTSRSRQGFAGVQASSPDEGRNRLRPHRRALFSWPVGRTGLGLRHLSGLKEESAEHIVAARNEAPFESA